ncbi:MAG: stage II sporulation protein E [Chloroflexi bacterium HGW-Chloroflexi-10]|nr:MAG: stage II sporulation protein E [Chloroflexi bacterium HGW-Chloroflexi-10]
MEIQLAVAKAIKYDSIESGDTIEVVERPMGGVSVVLVDGRSSGYTAKAVSSMVVRKVISLVSDGVRDGAAARAASDFLFMERGGTSSVYMNILSADFQTQTLVITRNNPTPVFIAQKDQIECISSESQPIGHSRNIRPAITEVPLHPYTTVVLYTDGLLRAGEVYGHSLDICSLVQAYLDEQEPSAQYIADSLLKHALRLDQNRPNDDMSVVVLRVLDKESDQIRRLHVQLPYRVDLNLD